MQMPQRLVIVAIALAFWSVCAHANSTVEQSCPGVAKWRESQATIQHEAPTTPSKPELRERLLLLAEEDQAVRSNGKETKAPPRPLLDMQSVDQRNYLELKQIVEKSGFPSVAEVGRDGVFSAWLIVQHASNDPAFQHKVLEIIKPRVSSGEIRGEQFALLYDRVSIQYLRKKQKYGTQIYPGSVPSVPLPIDDEGAVDERRSALGLMPLADYRCIMTVMNNRKLK